MDKRNAEFVRVARVAFADLRAEYNALHPTVTPSQFTAIVRERAPSDPTPWDYLSTAATLVREAREDAEHFDRMAEDAENARILEALHFVSADTERDWT
jgi:hypothetical protein